MLKNVIVYMLGQKNIEAIKYGETFKIDEFEKCLTYPPNASCV